MATDILTETYRQLRSRLTAMAAAMLGNRDEADDALQDAFCKLWGHHDAITDRSQAEGLLTVTVRNTGIDYIRRRRVTAPVDELQLTDETSHTCNDGLLDEVTAIIERELSERSRTILYQRDRDGLDFDEIAAHHNLTEANVRMILSRARRQVRDIYRKHNR